MAEDISWLIQTVQSTPAPPLQKQKLCSQTEENTKYTRFISNFSNIFILFYFGQNEKETWTFTLTC